MFKIYGKEYYIDVDAIIENCKIPQKPIINENVNDDDNETIESEELSDININIFKFETYKMLIDRILGGYENEGENDNDLFTERTTPESIKLSYNTLIKENIIKENDD